MNPRTKYALVSTGYSFLAAISGLALLSGFLWLLIWAPVWVSFIAIVGIVLGLFFWASLIDYDRNIR